jgi:hypothetical protein
MFRCHARAYRHMFQIFEDFGWERAKLTTIARDLACKFVQVGYIGAIIQVVNESLVLLICG